ncbi:MAG: Uncharacterised protein [Owenweeksia sp. TMED14]|nr:MAG: Uncharacterised protein [Owenweeksia sp. TMED14]
MESIKSLIRIDEALFLAGVNWGSDEVDYFFRLVSLSVGSYLFVSLFLAFGFFKLKLNKALVLAALVIAAVAISDFVSVHAFKNIFERLRPCHTPDLLNNFELAAKKCGGKYGFVSSHSSTVWAIYGIVNYSKPTVFINIFFLVWAIIVCYSRVYLGVHYPGDVLCGAVLGLSVAFVLNRWRATPIFNK